MQTETIKLDKGWHGNGSGCPFRNGSCKVEPLRDIKNIKAIKILLENKPRDLALFVLSINLGLRASDLLALQWQDVLNDGEIQAQVKIVESKTGKIKIIVLTKNSRTALETLFDKCKPQIDDFIFPSKKGGKKMSIQRFNQLVNLWTEEAGVEGNFGSQSLRKTFAHFALKKGFDIHLIMKNLNHKTPAMTLQYADFSKEDRNKIILGLNL